MSTQMKTLTIGSNTYEIVDEEARIAAGQAVKTINGVVPDEGGNVIVESSSVTIDTTLTLEGQAADSKAVGDAISSLSEEKVNKSGDTMTGKLSGPQFETGEADSAYFQSRRFRGEGNADTYYHAIDFGYANHDKVDFHEYGGTWNFYKNEGGTQSSGALIGAITPNGWEGCAKLTGSPTAPTPEKGTNTTQIATTAFVQGELPSIDSTLSTSGAAAEAKAVGDKFNDLTDAIESVKEQIALAPTTVESVDEMTDTSKEYVLSSTGTIWSYQETTVTGEITEQVEGDLVDSSRLGSDGSVQTGTGYAAYVTTPFIDLLAYPVPFTLHLDGGEFIPAASESYTRIASYTAEQTKITCVNVYSTVVDVVINVSDSDVTVDSDGNASILFSNTPKTNNDNNDGVLKYVRFSGKGSGESSSVYVTYEGEIASKGWVDTGVKYSSGSSVAITQRALEKMQNLNNEGSDPETITLLPAPVLDFYNSDDYPDDDYTVTHLSKITYPCRTDIPVPFTVKWEHNENAMRTTVAVDTKAIGTLNTKTMRTYDATGFDNYPIYNLLPNTTYYYKVTHILSDGSLVDVKSGSFTTSSESWRLIYIDGTQNVRDFGGWTGYGGKKVKYGKIFRGAAFSDSSFPGLMLTGKGRLALAELNVQAELNLGAVDSETSIAANCAYKKLYYTNYAIAITDESARANFKTLLEWIVSCLDGTLAVSGLDTVARNIYIHCQGGCDRTGTLSFLLLGLLGVSESDLAKEYELSSFSYIGLSRLRTTTKAVDVYDYVGMVEALKTYSGDTITDKFVDFATTGCGISIDTITSFRSLMLE